MWGSFRCPPEPPRCLHEKLESFLFFTANLVDLMCSHVFASVTSEDMTAEDAVVLNSRLLFVPAARNVLSVDCPRARRSVRQ